MKTDAVYDHATESAPTRHSQVPNDAGQPKVVKG
jgi:hypothetical protein